MSEYSPDEIVECLSFTPAQKEEYCCQVIMKQCKCSEDDAATIYGLLSSPEAFHDAARNGRMDEVNVILAGVKE